MEDPDHALDMMSEELEELRAERDRLKEANERLREQLEHCEADRRAMGSAGQRRAEGFRALKEAAMALIAKLPRCTALDDRPDWRCEKTAVAYDVVNHGSDTIFVCEEHAGSYEHDADWAEPLRVLSGIVEEK